MPVSPPLLMTKGEAKQNPLPIPANAEPLAVVTQGQAPTTWWCQCASSLLMPAACQRDSNVLRPALALPTGGGWPACRREGCTRDGDWHDVSRCEATCEAADR